VNEEIKQHLNKPIFFGDCVKQLEIKCDGDGAAKIRRWRDWSVVSRRLRRHGNATQFVDEIRRGSLGLYDGITIRYGMVWYGKGKAFPYSLPSVGPGADPGVQAVSPQLT